MMYKTTLDVHKNGVTACVLHSQLRQFLRSTSSTHLKMHFVAYSLIQCCYLELELGGQMLTSSFT